MCSTAVCVGGGARGSDALHLLLQQHCHERSTASAPCLLTRRKPAPPQVFGPALDVIGDKLPSSVPAGKGVINIGPLRVSVGSSPLPAATGRMHPILGALQLG